MHLTPEERAIGKDNFYGTIGFTRRDFLKGGLAAGLVSGAGLGAMYFGYKAMEGDPLRVGIIGTGDEGSVLIGGLTPSYLQVVAIADIRPYNVHRAFHGDQSSANTIKVRPGLMTKYDWKSEDEARKNVKVYDKNGYEELLDDPNVEAVVIALPLHLHAEAAIKAMRKGKHVLTEKLMGHDIAQCKEMGRVATETGKILAVGHQRHYSILYDNAVDTIRRGLIGDIHHVRAQWHRGNLPGNDSWQPPLPDDKMVAAISKTEEELSKAKGSRFDDLSKKLEQLKLQYLDHVVDAGKFGYEAKTLDGGYNRSALEELIRWRLWNRTGGGLMAELGSHQLDASGIFVSATRTDGKKVLPLSVSATGGRHIFPVDRECDDHVYCTYEYPGPAYDSDPNKKIVVTYSSINGNGFGGYGEVVMGTKGTLILEREQDVMIFKGAETATNVKVSEGKSGGPTLDTTQSGGGPAVETGKKAIETGPPSRGYTEELEHWAWCIRNPAPEHKPRCHPEVALADAVIALVTNMSTKKGEPIRFQPEWFKIDKDETPEGLTPNTAQDKYKV
ncbi:MAG: Gfo/Idh/MocA family oxidoreductase [Pirellulales bacterium]